MCVYTVISRIIMVVPPAAAPHSLSSRNRADPQLVQRALTVDVFIYKRAFIGPKENHKRHKNCIILFNNFNVL